MKKVILVIIAILAFQFGQAQSIDSLYGKWHFDGIYIPQGAKVDSAKLKMAMTMFKSMALEFKRNDTAVLSLFDKDEPAPFTYDKNKRTFTLKTQKGKETTIEIIKYTPKRMAVVMLKDMQVWLKLE